MNKQKLSLNNKANSNSTICIILFFAFIALLPILIYRDFTPSNELRYLSIADEALRNHNFFAFTNHGEIYADKPPLYLWIIMLGKTLFGNHSMLFLSLFSIIPAFIIAITMDRWIRPYSSKWMRITAMIMLLSTALFIGPAIVVRMDMLMAMFIILALRLFYKMEEEADRRKSLKYLFPFLIFMASFTKGPMGLLIPLCVTIVYLIIKKSAREIKEYWGIRTWSILLIMCIIWFTCTYLEGGRNYIYNQLIHQTVGRVVNSFNHDKPLYFYFISIWYSLAPWSLLVAAIMVAGIRKKIIKRAIDKFFVCMVVATFILLSLISSKLDIYMLPAFPFWIYLCALWLPRVGNNKTRTLSLLLPALLFTLAFLVDIHLYEKNHVFMLEWTLPSAAIITMTGIALIIILLMKKAPYCFYTLFFGLYIAIFLLGININKTNKYLGYRNLCNTINEISNKEFNGDSVYFCSIKRPENMDVFLNKRILRFKELSKSNFPKDGIVVIPSSKIPQVLPKGTLVIEEGPYLILIPSW